MKDFFGYSHEEPWFFTNYSFLLVLGIFLCVYALLQPHNRWKKIYLISFSLFFFYKSSGPYIGIFALMIILDYNLAQAIERVSRRSVQRLLMILSVVLSLSFLLYFKYSGLFLTTLNELTGTSFKISALFLPIGISFYTFQSVSYIVDVYNRRIHSSDNFIDYAFYMTFFPHLVAGPIVRAKDFIPQINTPLLMDRDTISTALFRIMKGLAKKLLVADFLAKYVDMVHANPSIYSGVENAVSMYAYTLQIYFDFSGYSDMAIGIALLLGYRLNENFDRPYQSTNITEFWRRWHISLSSWLRDYIYIPLGGNRRGRVNTYMFLMITMTIGGLWHGADWKFLVWGVLHGLALALHKLFTRPGNGNRLDKAFNMLSGIVTFHFVAVLWILFRAVSYDSAMASLLSMLRQFDPRTIPGFYMARPEFSWMMLLAFALVFFPASLREPVEQRLRRLPPAAMVLMLTCLLQIILQVKDQQIQPFIYFQF